MHTPITARGANCLHLARQQLCYALPDSARIEAPQTPGAPTTAASSNVTEISAKILRTQYSHYAGRSRHGEVQAVAGAAAVEVERSGMKRYLFLPGSTAYTRIYFYGNFGINYFESAQKLRLWQSVFSRLAASRQKHHLW